MTCLAASNSFHTAISDTAEALMVDAGASSLKYENAAGMISCALGCHETGFQASVWAACAALQSMR